jgi:hypothetical protein
MRTIKIYFKRAPFYNAFIVTYAVGSRMLPEFENGDWVERRSPAEFRLPHLRIVLRRCPARHCTRRTQPDCDMIPSRHDRI